MIVAVTRLRLRSVRFIPRLNWESMKIKRSVVEAPGFLGGKILVDRNHAYWTMTAWTDLDSMRAFRDSGAHAVTSLMLNKWCDEASVVHWETEDAELPSWKEAHQRMTEAGRRSPLKFESDDHKAGRVREPYLAKWREERLTPRPGRDLIAA
jgi:hypothetical protein